MGPGRPPLPDTERRRNKVSVVFTDGEWEALSAAAEGQPVASLVHDVMVRFLRRRR